MIIRGHYLKVLASEVVIMLMVLTGYCFVGIGDLGQSCGCGCGGISGDQLHTWG